MPDTLSLTLGPLGGSVAAHYFNILGKNKLVGENEEGSNYFVREANRITPMLSGLDLKDNVGSLDIIPSGPSAYNAWAGETEEMDTGKQAEPSLTPRYWTDVMEHPFGRDSLTTLPGWMIYPGGERSSISSVPAQLFFHGLEIFKRREVAEDYLDSVRRFAEKSSRVGCIQSFCDTTGFWSGVCIAAMEELRDEFRCPLAIWSCSRESEDDEVISPINTAALYCRSKDIGAVVVPFDFDALSQKSIDGDAVAASFALYAYAMTGSAVRGKVTNTGDFFSTLLGNGDLNIVTPGLASPLETKVGSLSEIISSISDLKTIPLDPMFTPLNRCGSYDVKAYSSRVATSKLLVQNTATQPDVDLAKLTSTFSEYTTLACGLSPREAVVGDLVTLPSKFPISCVGNPEVYHSGEDEQVVAVAGCASVSGSTYIELQELANQFPSSVSRLQFYRAQDFGATSDELEDLSESLKAHRDAYRELVLDMGPKKPKVDESSGYYRSKRVGKL